MAETPEPPGEDDRTDVDEVESGEAEPASRPEEVERAQEREEDAAEG